jgi:hypothetical protein
MGHVGLLNSNNKKADTNLEFFGGGLGCFEVRPVHFLHFYNVAVFVVLAFLELEHACRFRHLLQHLRDIWRHGNHTGSLKLGQEDPERKVSAGVCVTV